MVVVANVSFVLLGITVTRRNGNAKSQLVVRENCVVIQMEKEEIV